MGTSIIHFPQSDQTGHSGPTPQVQLGPGGVPFVSHQVSHDSGFVAEENLFSKLEAFVLASRGLEQSLQKEKIRNKQLEHDYKSTQSQYENLFRELESKNRELLVSESKTKSLLIEASKSEAVSKHKLEQMSEHYRSLSAELNQYRGAWSEVLRRESEAKQFLREEQDLKEKVKVTSDRLAKLEDQIANEVSARENAERQAKTYQSELDQVLTRLQGSEARFTELKNEFELLYETRKQFDEELAKAEEKIKERMDWTLLTEREQFKNDLEKKSIEAVKDSIETGLATERERLGRQFDQMESQVKKAQERLASVQLEYNEFKEGTQSSKDQFETKHSVLTGEIEKLKDGGLDLVVFDDLIKEKILVIEVAERDISKAELENKRQQDIIVLQKIRDQAKNEKTVLETLRSRFLDQKKMRIEAYRSGLEKDYITL